ncbi:unnamed protein product, partial [Rotaria magnacalcarata]
MQTGVGASYFPRNTFVPTTTKSLDLDSLPEVNSERAR